MQIRSIVEIWFSLHLGTYLFLTYWQPCKTFLLPSNFFQIYENYYNHLEEMLVEIDVKIKKQRPIEDICRGFETQKVCYLPLNTFFIRPGQRLLHIKFLLERKWDSTLRVENYLSIIYNIKRIYLKLVKRISSLKYVNSFKTINLWCI